MRGLAAPETQEWGLGLAASVPRVGPRAWGGPGELAGPSRATWELPFMGGETEPMVWTCFIFCILML